MSESSVSRDSSPVKVAIAFEISAPLLSKVKSTPVPVEVVAATSREKLTPAQLAEAEVVICWDFGPEQLALSPKLRWIHKMSTGVDRMLYPEFVQSPVVLTNAAGAHAIPIAEHVIGVMLAMVKELPKAARRQRQHQWIKEHTRELYGQTLGIVGMGHVGTAIARLAKAMSMTTLAVRRRDLPAQFVDEMVPMEQLHQMLGRSDFVVVTLPLTPSTRGMFGPEEFRAMRPGAYFINIARGQIVREDALIDALRTGKIAGAMLDVAAVEPLPAESPLWDMENVIITPHTSGHSTRVNERAMDLFCENLVRYRKGEALVNVVDKLAGY
ncbi:MAG TPA: D-2-hydroxyacid dehydrogenase [Chloroflexota bacterium]